MRKLHEELQRHIHGDLCSEVNKMIIRLKINSDEIMENQTEEQADKILEARGHHKQPTGRELIDLLSRVRDEMNECKEPYRRH